MNPQTTAALAKNPPRPDRIAIALALAQEAQRPDFEGDAGNVERGELADVIKHLEATPPRVVAARRCAETGVAHSWREHYHENRRESWACAAVAELLKT